MEKKTLNKRIAIIAISGVVLVGSVAFAINGNKNNNIDPWSSNCWSETIVLNNQSLYEIAKKKYGNGQYYKMVAFFNKIADARLIYPNQVIELPSKKDLILICNTLGYVDATPVPQTTPIQIIENKPTNTPSNEFDYKTIYGWNYVTESDYTPNMNNGNYMIRKGNKLFGIAKFYYGNGGYDDALALYNNIENKHDINVGQIIVIPSEDELINATGCEELDHGNYIPINRYNEIHGTSYQLM